MSEIFEIEQGDIDKVQGVWKGAKMPTRRTALLSCPGCGSIAGLQGHRILDDGIVEPSVVCPEAGCDFHKYVKLVGWTP